MLAKCEVLCVGVGAIQTFLGEPCRRQQASFTLHTCELGYLIEHQYADELNIITAKFQQQHYDNEKQKITENWVKSSSCHHIER